MKVLKPVLMSALLTISLLSCDNGDEQASQPLSPIARNYLTMKMGSMTSNSMASASGLNNMANESLSRLSNNAGFSFGRLKGDSTSGGSDTTWHPSPWITCAVITTTENKDHSVTTVYDYGDGCVEGNEYFKYLMQGKYTYTYLYENERTGSVYRDRYAGSYSTENYGGEYYYEGDTSRWSSDGSSTYAGTSEYDTVRQSYRGEYEYDGHDQSSYNGVTYTYSGSGKGYYNEKGSVQERNDYSYSTAEYSYEARVLEPLVTRYDCYQMDEGSPYLIQCFIPIYVSGRETVAYRDGESQGSFEIDYGDGECDSIVIIIENGKRTRVDLYRLYENP